MKTKADKTPEKNHQAAANSLSKVQTYGESAFQFSENRPETVAQRKLQEAIHASPQVVQLRTVQEMAKNISSQTTKPQNTDNQQHNASSDPIQRIIEIQGGGEEFENIVVRFCTFAKAQGGEAWEMLSWFWHGENNSLDIVSVTELGSQGYTDCRIGGKEAHTLTNEEWAELNVDVPAKVIVSIKNSGGQINKNDAKQYYVILHELMVHTYPFYKKIKRVREGAGPRDRAEAGYSDGRDNMGAHAEHQDLLLKNNNAFYDLYDFMNGKMVAGLFHEIEEEFKGISPADFHDSHEEDLMMQYIEEAMLKAKNAHAKVLRIHNYMSEMRSQELSKQQKLLRYEHVRAEFLSVQAEVREVWDDYHKAYTAHTQDYKPPGWEENQEPVGEFGPLPYFNPDA